MDRNEKSLLATLIYSSIFEYPLTEDEIYRYVISPKKLTKNEVNKSLKNLLKNKKIFYKKGFYYLPEMSLTIEKRLERKKISEKKMKKAKEIAKLLLHIPTIQLIGISGSLAMNNTEEDDDIDYFIITLPYTLWMTRLLCLILLMRNGLRRRGRNEQNSICLNMFMDESNLLLPKHKRNLYSAHEVIQMKPIFMKNNMYKKFLYANQWVKDFLPNNTFDARLKAGATILFWFFSPFEYLCRAIQLWYMKNYRTTETVTSTMLAFHPQDNTQYVLTIFRKQCGKYGI